MYSYEWDKQTRGYCLKTCASKFIASEIRPVFSEELTITGLEERLEFDKKELRPLLWAKQNVYIYKGEEIAKLRKTRYGQAIDIEWRGVADWDTTGINCKKVTLSPIKMDLFIARNSTIMSALVADTLKRIKEMYDAYAHRCDVVYIGFSGGKDSVVLLDLCHKVLPLDVPVVFSDTDMELPDTYKVWDEVQKRYPERTFIKANATKSAIENWHLFGPPSRSVRWCCAVHKSAPALLQLRKQLATPTIKAAAFLGVRGEESISRSSYQDIGEGVKNSSQINLMPILNWGAHELWLYLLQKNLIINCGYRYGLARIGCILCPESSDKYTWFVNAIYPEAIMPFTELVIQMSSKNFSSLEESQDFLGSSNWQARRSGIALKENILQPVEKISDLKVEWRCAKLELSLFFEWLKTIGSVSIGMPNKKAYVIIRNGQSNGISCDIDIYQSHYTKIGIFFINSLEKRKALPLLRSVLHKAIACVNCQACEIECHNGALCTRNGILAVDETKCIHCLQCHRPDLGCWRYRSMRVPETSKSTLSGINLYKNFGLRMEFLSIYLEEKELFDQTTKLNRAKQVPAAKAWFRQALLMDMKTTNPMPLLRVFEVRGLEDDLPWMCAWVGLSNYAPIIKWLTCTLKQDVYYSNADLFDLLGSDIKDVTKKGGLQALKNMLDRTPFGSITDGLVTIEKKGSRSLGLTRHSYNVDPLVILYGLYVIAEKAGRSEFTIRQLMIADFESDFVSPLVAFAMTPDDFKKQCVGLSSLYPDFISCSFTLGLDEIQLFPTAKSCNDVVELILQK